VRSPRVESALQSDEKRHLVSDAQQTLQHVSMIHDVRALVICITNPACRRCEVAGSRFVENSAGVTMARGLLMYRCDRHNGHTEVELTQSDRNDPENNGEENELA
jgi:hypothetical protein